MKAMILAAGLGTRLRPLTLKRPKALVPVRNVPSIDWVIGYLKSQGIEKIVVNAHHHSDQIVQHLERGGPFGMSVEVRVEQDILGTGGGIKNTADFWDDEPFVVINGDILTNIDLHDAYAHHREKRSLATLILHERIPFNQVLVDRKLNILDISEKNLERRLAFTGIHIIDPELLSYIPTGVYSNIIECYRNLIRSGSPVSGYKVEGHRWLDIGTIESYTRANKAALAEQPFLIDEGCSIDPSAELNDWAVIGKRGKVEGGTEISRSILWEDVRVKKGIRIVDSIVTGSRTVDRDLLNEAL